MRFLGLKFDLKSPPPLKNFKGGAWAPPEQKSAQKPGLISPHRPEAAGFFN